MPPYAAHNRAAAGACARMLVCCLMRGCGSACLAGPRARVPSLRPSRPGAGRGTG